MPTPSFPVRDTLYGDATDEVFELNYYPYSVFGITPDLLGYAVYAGAGNDTVYGTEHSDLAHGELGNDRLYGNGGDDWLIGGGGEDRVYGGRGIDTVEGNSGNDHLEGNADNDFVYGGSGNDTIYGDNFDLSDKQAGATQGNDQLFGDSGNDTMYGQGGNDTLDGGRGRDTMSGGAGADTFRFTGADYVATYTNTPQMDRITDFSAAAGDKLDLASLIDLTNAANGITAAHAIAQGYIYFVQHGTQGQPGFGTSVYVDKDGGAHAPLFGPAGGPYTPLYSDIAVVDLDGVAANSLTAAQFMV